MLYLAGQEAQRQGTQRLPNWGEILGQLVGLRLPTRRPAAPAVRRPHIGRERPPPDDLLGGRHPHRILGTRQRLRTDARREHVVQHPREGARAEVFYLRPAHGTPRRHHETRTRPRRAGTRSHGVLTPASHKIDAVNIREDAEDMRHGIPSIKNAPRRVRRRLDVNQAAKSRGATVGRPPLSQAPEPAGLHGAHPMQLKASPATPWVRPQRPARLWASSALVPESIRRGIIRNDKEVFDMIPRWAGTVTDPQRPARPSGEGARTVPALQPDIHPRSACCGGLYPDALQRYDGSC